MTDVTQAAWEALLLSDEVIEAFASFRLAAFEAMQEACLDKQEWLEVTQDDVSDISAIDLQHD